MSMAEQSSERRWKPLLWLGMALAAVAAIVALRWRRRPSERPPTLRVIGCIELHTFIERGRNNLHEDKLILYDIK